MPPTESRNRKIQYGCQAAILKMTLLKINKPLPIYISIVPLNFEVDIQSQRKVSVWKPKNFQYGRQAAILKVTSLKINRLLSMAIINMYMKFEIEIPKRTWLMLLKPCRLQTDGRTDGRTDGQCESSIPPPPLPSNFVGRGYKKVGILHGVYPISQRLHYGWVVDQAALTLVQPRRYPLTRCEAVSNPR